MFFPISLILFGGSYGAQWFLQEWRSFQARAPVLYFRKGKSDPHDAFLMPRYDLRISESVVSRLRVMNSLCRSVLNLRWVVVMGHENNVLNTPRISASNSQDFRTRWLQVFAQVQQRGPKWSRMHALWPWPVHTPRRTVRSCAMKRTGISKILGRVQSRNIVERIWT